MSTTQHASTKEDILRYLLRQGEANAQELADALRISPQAVRRHLKDLEAEELIVHQDRHEGMGRPQHVYHLSKQGRSRFPQAYDDFALSLLDTLADAVPPDQFGEILQQQWLRKAHTYRRQLGQGSLQERLVKLVELRQAEGYMAEWRPAEQVNGNQSIGDTSNLHTDDAATHAANQAAQVEFHGNGHAEDLAGNDSEHDPNHPEGTERFILTEYHCSIASVARSFPTVCDYELELFMHTLPDCKVERTHWQIEGQHQCGYLITRG